jgi:hypothetical protein
MIQGEVLAIFPEIPATAQSWFCLSYASVGQHSAASVAMTSAGRRATPEEYAPLRRELETIGYVLEIRTRRTAAMDNARRETLNRQLV